MFCVINTFIMFVWTDYIMILTLLLSLCSFKCINVACIKIAQFTRVLDLS